MSQGEKENSRPSAAGPVACGPTVGRCLVRLPANPPLRLTGCLLSMLLVVHAPARAGTPPASRSPGAPRDPLVLTYIANEGVLLASGHHKVLIDALFDRPDSAY